jgi:hypothetical protein
MPQLQQDGREGHVCAVPGVTASSDALPSSSSVKGAMCAM